MADGIDGLEDWPARVPLHKGRRYCRDHPAIAFDERSNIFRARQPQIQQQKFLS